MIQEFFLSAKITPEIRALHIVKHLPQAGRILSATPAPTPAAILVLIPIHTIQVLAAQKLPTTVCRAVVMILQRREVAVGTAPTVAAEITASAAILHSIEQSLRLGTVLGVSEIILQNG